MYNCQPFQINNLIDRFESRSEQNYLHTTSHNITHDSSYCSDVMNSEFTSENQSTLSTAKPVLKLRRKKKQERKLEEALLPLQDNTSDVRDSVIVDDFFSYQLGEKPQPQDVTMTPIAVEKSPETLDKCKNCESTNSLVFNQKEGTRVCTECGCVQEMGVID